MISINANRYYYLSILDPITKKLFGLGLNAHGVSPNEAVKIYDIHSELEQAQSNNDNAFAAHMLWRFVQIGESNPPYYNIINKNSGYFLSIKNELPKSGAYIIQNPRSYIKNEDSALWTINGSNIYSKLTDNNGVKMTLGTDTRYITEHPDEHNEIILLEDIGRIIMNHVLNITLKVEGTRQNSNSFSVEGFQSGQEFGAVEFGLAMTSALAYSIPHVGATVANLVNLTSGYLNESKDPIEEIYPRLIRDIEDAAFRGATRAILDEHLSNVSTYLSDYEGFLAGVSSPTIEQILHDLEINIGYFQGQKLNALPYFVLATSIWIVITEYQLENTDNPITRRHYISQLGIFKTYLTESIEALINARESEIKIGPVPNHNLSFVIDSSKPTIKMSIIYDDGAYLAEAKGPALFSNYGYPNESLDSWNDIYNRWDRDF